MKSVISLGALGTSFYLGQGKIQNFFSSGPNYEQIREDIANILIQDEWDGYSHIGPLLVRLAWHSSGTYDRETNTGGSVGSGMRYGPEQKDPANAGLKHAQNFLEPIKQKHPSISYSDLWVLASYVAIEEMGGPKINFIPGRKDNSSEGQSPPNGRLPDALGDSSHIREVFTKRMGFTDREIVALIGGGHGIGKCHPDRSGFDGPWTNQPISISNEYFKELFKNEWKIRNWQGPKQYEDKNKRLMMLPADMEMKNDPSFKKWSELYRADRDQLLVDFGDSFKKLTELGFSKIQGV